MVHSTKKVSTGCKVLGCSDTHEKGTKTTSLHITSGRDQVPDRMTAAHACLGTLARRPQGQIAPDFLTYTMALTTFPKRTKAKYMCPSGNILYSMADNGVKGLNRPWPVKWLKGKQDSC